ncbi:universal stress protein [Halobium salinum]|uniref:Universal stress protein n=1 Tax=Halobium salinum TaxID=1364940 RepID=A0ABD5PCW3_9EURY|nr:universal stress protein [Halobium salinum]
MYERVLLATDGSVGAAVATAQAVTLAAAFGSTLHVVSVVPTPGRRSASATGDSGPPLDDAAAALATSAEAAVDDAETTARERGLRVETAVERGRPHRVVLEHADRVGADLVVVGRHGRTNRPEFLLGSTAERVVREATTPVLTATGADGFADVTAVLLPTDGSRGSLAALPHAAALARQFDAPVHVLAVTDVSVFDPDVVVGLLGGLARLSERYADAAAATLDAEGISTETAIGEGVPAREILDYATEVGADLITMGTRGRRGTERLLLGSTASKVLRGATRPVLTVRSPSGRE